MERTHTPSTDNRQQLDATTTVTIHHGRTPCANDDRPTAAMVLDADGFGGRMLCRPCAVVAIAQPRWSDWYRHSPCGGGHELVPLADLAHVNDDGRIGWDVVCDERCGGPGGDPSRSTFTPMEVQA